MLHSQELKDMSQNPALPPSSTDDSKAFRHDLRNALSPAMLCADILTSHSDESVRKHAGTIVEALEKALRLLKKPTSSQ